MDDKFAIKDIDMNQQPEKKPVFYVYRNYLKAALRAAPKNDLRYYLCGVYIEANATHTTMVVTNGHYLLVLRKGSENRLDKPISLIMSREICENVLKQNSKSLQNIGITQESGNEFSTTLTSVSPAPVLHFQGVDAKYPDWKKVIPEKITGHAGSFNADYLQLFKSVAADINGIFELLQNGNTDASIVLLDTEIDCFAVVMPMRAGIDAKAWKTPAWAQKPKEKPPAKKKAAQEKKEAVAA